VADAVSNAVASLEPRAFAVIGLGRAARLSYASDIDVIFVYDADRVRFAPPSDGDATRGPSATGFGPHFRVMRLRPKGRQGALARSLAAPDYFDSGPRLEFQRSASRFVAARRLAERLSPRARVPVFDPFPEGGDARSGG